MADAPPAPSASDGPLARHVLALPDPAATDALGAALARGAAPGLYLALDGDLGAGKTSLARALLRTLGVHGRIRSPSFTLVEPYNSNGLPIFHFDFYRFDADDEWSDAGFDEHFDGSALCIVEWPGHAGPGLRAPDLRVVLEPDGDGRRATLSAGSAQGAAWLTATIAALPR